jgi:hypothetical protein
MQARIGVSYFEGMLSLQERFAVLLARVEPRIEARSEDRDSEGASYSKLAEDDVSAMIFHELINSKWPTCLLIIS